MCGLTGYWAFEATRREALESSVVAMTDALSHRGPDDHGIWVDADAGLALGHRRLSIIDLSSAGHQPMATPEGRFVLVFNGELYNFRALRTELEAQGVAFRSKSDTEVALLALATWGVEAALERFVGMFAFALWDGRERTLTLGRDRLGIKPLYYGWSNDRLFFGSELKALRRHPDFRAELNRDALALFFRHNYIPAPHTVYRGIEKIEPGCIVVVSPSRDVQRRRYWSLREVAKRGLAEPLPASPAEIEEELEALLGQAVQDRLVADVPLGAFLSGGIDSSTVVALMRAAGTRDVRTFTVGFHEEGFDEARHAAAVARHLGTEHHELYVTSEEAREVIPSIPDHWDEPFSDSSQIPTFLVSRFARESVTVTLSGDGGDELFGGYPRYDFARRVDRYVRLLPRPALRLLGRMIRGTSSRVWDGMSRRSRGAQPGAFASRMSRVAELLHTLDRGSLYQHVVSHWKSPEALVPGANEPATILASREIERELPELLERMMFLDSVTYLPDDILTKVDRASMAVGLEARVPLLDHRVVELAWRVPRALRVGPSPGKRLLRNVLRRHVPAELFERPKMGFGIPVSAWLRGPLREWGEELLDARRLAGQGVLAVEPVRRRWEEHVSGRHDWGYYLWDVLVFQAWYERWMT